MNKKIVEGIKKRSEEAFNEFYEEYHKLIFYVILKITKNAEVAKDLTQETFLCVYNKIDQYNGGNFKYWVLQIAKNYGRNYVTRVANKDQVILDDLYIQNLPDDKIVYRDIDSFICNNLEKEESEIVIMRVILDYTFKEISEELSIPLTTVYRIYKQSIKKLKTISKGGKLNE